MYVDGKNTRMMSLLNNDVRDFGFEVGVNLSTRVSNQYKFEFGHTVRLFIAHAIAVKEKTSR